MKKRTRLHTFLSLLIAILIFGNTVACSVENEEEMPTHTESESVTESEAKESEKEDDELPEKSIDIYLIAGQSNATGYSKISDREAAYAWAPALENGFSNIHYAGNSRSNGAGNRDRDIDWQNVCLGLGATGELFGPEAGMAKAMSESAANTRFRYPLPGPRPNRPPEAMHISARVC